MARACQKHVLRFALASLLLLSGACADPLAKQKGLTDSDLFSRGSRSFAKRSWSDAIDAFRLLLERFPASPLAPRAQLGLADAKREHGDDADAESAYDDFLRLYPAHDNVPYALARKGDLLARDAPSPGRDQTKTVEALKTFSMLREKAPTGPFAGLAAERIRALRARLARHEELVIRHYLSTRKYDSAQVRARRAVEEYRDTPVLPSLMALLADALARGGNAAEAAEVRKSLDEKFPRFGEKRK